MVETCSLVSESMRAKRRWSYRSRPYICRLFGQRSCFGKLRIRPIARIPERRLNIRTVKDSRERKERKEMSCFNHTRLFNLNSTDRTRFFKITNLFPQIVRDSFTGSSSPSRLRRPSSSRRTRRRCREIGPRTSPGWWSRSGSWSSPRKMPSLELMNLKLCELKTPCNFCGPWKQELRGVGCFRELRALVQITGQIFSSRISVKYHRLKSCSQIFGC